MDPYEDVGVVTCGRRQSSPHRSPPQTFILIIHRHSSPDPCQAQTPHEPIYPTVFRIPLRPKQQKTGQNDHSLENRSKMNKWDIRHTCSSCCLCSVCLFLRLADSSRRCSLSASVRTRAFDLPISVGVSSLGGI